MQILASSGNRRQRPTSTLMLLLMVLVSLGTAGSSSANYFTIANPVSIDINTPGNVNGVVGTLLPVSMSWM